MFLIDPNLKLTYFDLIMMLAISLIAKVLIKFYLRHLGYIQMSSDNAKDV